MSHYSHITVWVLGNPLLQKHSAIAEGASLLEQLWAA